MPGKKGDQDNQRAGKQQAEKQAARGVLGPLVDHSKPGGASGI
jgi:hypothetical protein